jgi:hypothetical protein
MLYRRSVVYKIVRNDDAADPNARGNLPSSIQRQLVEIREQLLLFTSFEVRFL